MHVADKALVLSATDLSGYLACGHLTAQDLAVTQGAQKPWEFDDPGAEVLRQRGHEHEERIVAAYEAEGLNVVRLTKPPWTPHDGGEPDAPPPWIEYAENTLEAMRAGADVIHQACFFDGRWLGLPDFLIRVPGESTFGDWAYEVVDAKLSREAKVGAVLQICSYSEMLERVQGVAPERMHLALGGLYGFEGEETPGPGGFPLETFRVADFAAYFRSVKRRFVQAIDGEPETYPEPCAHCTVCKWSQVCKARWREDDHLSLVAGITRKQRGALEALDVTTLESLAGLPLPPEQRLEGVSDASYAKVREQARIQLEGRLEERPKYELLLNNEVDTGLLALPEPSPGDLFFDIEGDPHAFHHGLEYLLGYVDVDGEFTGLWALDPDEERAQFERFIDTVMERRERWPGMHVYHYAAYEQTAIKRLAGRYGTREEEVDQLLRGRVFVDLYRVVRQGLRASVESYSIKKMEPLYGFERDVELREAGSALANFEAWLQLGGAGDGGAAQSDLLQEIEGYNRDDCVSTLRLRAWLEERRPELEGLLRAQHLLTDDLPRPELGEKDASEKTAEENERVQALFDRLTDGVPESEAERSPEQHARWLLAHLLAWHRREKKSMWWEYFRTMALDDQELIHDSKTLGDLEYVGEADRTKYAIVHRYQFPPQDFALRSGDKPRDPATEAGAGKVVSVNLDSCTIDLSRGLRSEAPHPRALIPFDDVPDEGLREALLRLADDIADHGVDGANQRAAVALLLRTAPRTGQTEGAPLRHDGETNLAAARRIATQLDHSVLPIQGPPGSGKTYIGARMIVSLIKAGKRVGVTATSHKVIVNMLDAVCAAAREEGVSFRGVQKARKKAACQDDAIECSNVNKKVETLVADGEVDLVAGTAWLWAREKMQGALDVLVVDEAGQISLANVLAAAGAAESVVLLGDPKQLEQPQQGTHPPGTGVAALEHLVGDHTLEAHRGLFLNETWRLHPDICAFTSELFYEGRLTSRGELDTQSVDGPEPFNGPGLRLHDVEHEGNSSESVEEVRVVAELLKQLLEADSTWIDASGTRRPLRAADVLVVAPYNAQVLALRAGIPKNVAVGTVDKFQGQEAPVVIYSTATSSVADAPRGMEFLFNPNRLNVATSRARCVVVLVGSSSLLGPNCKSVRQMQLANGLCRFGEMAGRMGSVEHG